MNTKFASESRVPTTTTGRSIWMTLTPLARIAVISLSLASWQKP